MAHDNRSLLAGIYAGYTRGDAQPLFAALAADVEFRLCGPADLLPVAGAYRGPVGVRDAIKAINDEYQWLRYELRRLIVEGDTAMALTGGRLRHRRSRVEMEMDLANLVHIQDGRIVSFAEFFDTAGLLAWQEGAPAPLEPSALAKRLVEISAADGDPTVNRRNVEACYAAYARRNPQVFIDLMDNDAWYFTVARAEDFAFAATPRGKAAFAADMLKIATEFDLERYDVREVIADGAFVGVHADVAFRAKESGNLVTAEKLDMFRFVGGRIAEFIEFFDTATALRQRRGGATRP